MAQLSHYQWLGIRRRKRITDEQDKGSVVPEKRRKKLFTEGRKRSNKDNILSFYTNFEE